MKMLRAAALIAAVVSISLAVATGAQATTFCVPTSSACPGGSGIAKADLEEAMGSNAEDGQADTVYVAAGTYVEDADFEPEPPNTDTITFEVDGNDDLTVIGAGPGATIMTSAGSKNAYVVNLSYNNGRDVTMRNLGIEVPPSFPDGLGAGILLFEGDVLENVAVVSFNDESDAVKSGGDGNRFLGGVIRDGGLEGSIQDGVSVEFGEGVVEDVEIEGAAWGLVTGSNASSHLVARRVHEIGTRNYGAINTVGTITLENSVIETDDGVGLYVSSSAGSSLIEADQVTVQNFGDENHPAMEVIKSSGAGNSTMEVSNSILRGFGSGYKEQATFGPGIGVATLKVSYSNFQSSGTANAVTDLATGNLDADPLLDGDLALPPGSPSIDAGDPAAGGLATDFLGAPRPKDGNGDGVAVRDQGAFEHQPPEVPGGGSGNNSGDSGNPNGNPPVDKAPPQTTLLKGPGSKLDQGKAKFAFRSSEPGSTFTCKLDKRKAKPCRSPKTCTGLKPGRHRFKVWAIDKAGNKDQTPAKKRFRVPA